jgi:hypothetical protein
MEYYKSEKHKLNTINPKQIINWINIKYPQLKGMCFYDKNEKCLVSLDADKYYFYFDPNHTVLDIIFFKH